MLWGSRPERRTSRKRNRMETAKIMAVSFIIAIVKRR